MKKRIMGVAFAAVLAVTGFVAGCGGSSDGGGGGGGGAQITDAQTANVASAAAMNVSMAALSGMGGAGAMTVKALEAKNVADGVAIGSVLSKILDSSKADQSSYTVASDLGGSCTVTVLEDDSSIELSIDCDGFTVEFELDGTDYTVVADGLLTLTVSGGEDSGSLSIVTSNWTSTINGVTYTSNINVTITFTMTETTLTITTRGMVDSVSVDSDISCNISGDTVTCTSS